MEQRSGAYIDSITDGGRCSLWRGAMGDRAGKKDKDKNQRQQSEKREQKAQVRLGKSKTPSTGGAVRTPTAGGQA